MVDHTKNSIAEAYGKKCMTDVYKEVGKSITGRDVVKLFVSTTISQTNGDDNSEYGELIIKVMFNVADEVGGKLIAEIGADIINKIDPNVVDNAGDVYCEFLDIDPTLVPSREKFTINLKGDGLSDVFKGAQSMEEFKEKISNGEFSKREVFLQLLIGALKSPISADNFFIILAFGEKKLAEGQDNIGKSTVMASYIVDAFCTDYMDKVGNEIAKILNQAEKDKK